MSEKDHQGICFHANKNQSDYQRVYHKFGSTIQTVNQMKLLLRILSIALLFQYRLARIFLISSYEDFEAIAMCKRPFPLGYTFLFLHAPMKEVDILGIFYDYPHARYQWIDGFMSAICSADQELRCFNSTRMRSLNRHPTVASTFNSPYLGINYEIVDMATLDKEQVVFKTCIKIVRTFHFSFCENQRLKQIVIQNADEEVLEGSEPTDNPSSERSEVHFENIIEFCMNPRGQNLSLSLTQIPEESYDVSKIHFTDICKCRFKVSQ